MHAYDRCDDAEDVQVEKKCWCGGAIKTRPGSTIDALRCGYGVIQMLVRYGGEKKSI